MRNLVSVLLGLSMLAYLIYVIYKMLIIGLGKSDESFADIQTHLIVAGVLLLLVFFGALSDKKNAPKAGQTITNKKSRPKLKPVIKSASKPKETNTLIITAQEPICDQLEGLIKDHPLVINTFQDTGNWYTNGETGPEWFTLHIETASKNCNKIDALVDEQLTLINKSANNRYWQ